MAGVSVYGRGQDAPRQSGSEPSPYRMLPEVQADTTWAWNVTYLGAKSWFVRIYEIMSSTDRFSST